MNEMGAGVPGGPSARVRSSTGTQTFLFTDIEGATRLAQQLGDRFPQVLLEQRAVLLGAIERGGGHEQGDRGDGSFIVFASARDAVAAAVAAQRALGAHAWPAGTSVRVRMGLHSGESEVVDEAGDPDRPGVYAGFDVFRAARIAAAGHGGQVLVSQTTRQLVERELPAELELRDLGSHVLKDIDRPEQLWQVAAADLPSDFPPLRTVSARPGNLPLDPAPLVGREREVEAVRTMLRREGVRLVTLAGPAGTGKTRVAIEAGRRIADDFQDGAHFVSLGSVADSGMVLTRIAESLALSQPGAASPAEVLSAWCRQRRLLFVLDDFERVVEAGGAVSELLASCPGLKVLVTSRIVLRVKGEHEFLIPPLAVPEPVDGASIARLALVPSVALFVQRAQAVRPAFEMTAENAADVARICSGLDGLPLAIELAAARVKLLPPQALVARLGQRLDLLKGGARDLPQRQQTLRDAIDWSYDLLGAGERGVFRRLASFDGGFTLDAAAAVCGAGEEDALDTIASLIDNSLLHMTDGPDGDPRYGMLATIREYGLERLRREGEEDTLRAAHAAYFLALAEQAEPELTKDRQAAWLRRLEVEHDNLRAALEWLEGHGDDAAALRLGAALWRFWVTLGVTEGFDRLTRLLALPGAQQPSDVRARMLQGVGTIHVSRGEAATASRMMEEALAIRRELADTSGVVASLNGLSWLEVMQGDSPRAEAYASEALALGRELGDPRAAALSLNSLAFVALHRSDFARSRELFSEALELRQRAGDRRGMAYMRVNLAAVEALQGRLDLAATLVEDAATTLRELGDQMTGAWAHLTAARIERARGEDREALARLHAAIEIWREGTNRSSLAWTLAEAAATELDVGTLEGAARSAEEALALARGTGSRTSLSYVLPQVALVASALGDPNRANALLREALDLAGSIGDRLLSARAHEGLARIALGAGDPAAAGLLAEADAIRAGIGAPRSVAEGRGLEALAVVRPAAQES
jgi:predicted ATPase/class 3 adenylate cyclase